MSARSGGRPSARDRTVTSTRPFGLVPRPVSCRRAPLGIRALTRGFTRLLRCPMASVSVRYIVDDVDAAIAFYCGHLGFAEVMHPAPTFAMLTRGDLRLVLSAPGGGPGGGQAMPDGRVPEPGRRSRFSLQVDALDG